MQFQEYLVYGEEPNIRGLKAERDLYRKILIEIAADNCENNCRCCQDVAEEVRRVLETKP